MTGSGSISSDKTSIYESVTGALNKAPLSMSGRYKIVITESGKFYLDDYTGRRIPLDIGIPVLPQISMFLNVSSELIDDNQTLYGGFQRSNQCSWHIPLHITKDYPKFLILNRLNNNDLNIFGQDLNNVLNSDVTIVKVIDISKTGLYKIFEEFNNVNNNLLFNLDQFGYPHIVLNGYDIIDQTPGSKTLPIKAQSINDINKYIINSYIDNNIINTNFINIEFEFSDITNGFSNYIGYLSYENLINDGKVDLIKAQLSNIIAYDFNKYRKISTDYMVQSVMIPSHNVYVNELNNQDYLYRISVKTFDIGDEFTIRVDNQIIYNKKISKSDVVYNGDVPNILATFRRIFSNVTELTIKVFTDLTIEFSHYEQFTLDLLDGRKYKDIDGNNHVSKNIIDTDLLLLNYELPISTDNDILINGKLYEIVDNFKFIGSNIIRLNKNHGVKFKTSATLYSKEFEKLYDVKPIPFLSFINGDNYSGIESLEILPLYDGINYKNQLTSLYSGNSPVAFKKELEDFIIYNEAIKPYSDIHISDISFVNGSNCNLAPNILNTDKVFGKFNNCVTDEYNKYSYFLIKVDKLDFPEYLKNDIRFLRYFTENEGPKITSKIKRVSNELSSCVFLGVNYQLPYQCEGYDFAVYADMGNNADKIINYRLDIDNVKKTVHLVINKYINYPDLIRQADPTKPPLFDLSLLYNIRNSANSSQVHPDLFVDSGFRWGYPKDNMYYNGNKVDNWIIGYVTKINDSHILSNTKILINSSLYTIDFRDMYIPGENVEFRVFTDIGDKKISVVKGTFVSISDINSDYFWCDDIKFTLYPDEFYLKDGDEYKLIDSKTLLNDSITVDVIAQTYNQRFKQNITVPEIGTLEALMYLTTNSLGFSYNDINLENRTLSLKAHYFELHSKYINSSLYKWDIRTNEFINPQLTTNDLEMLFITPPDINSSLTESFNTSEIGFENELNLFDLNPIWSVLKNLSINCKGLVRGYLQVSKDLNQYSINNLKLNLINPIKSGDYYVKIDIVEPETNFQLYRHIGVYTPLLPMINENDFISRYYKFQYDSNKLYGKISSNQNTGLQGNIVSTLYTNYNDVTIEYIYTNPFNINDVITDKNLLQLYKIKQIESDGKRLNYTILNDIISMDNTVNNIKIVLTRK